MKRQLFIPAKRVAAAASAAALCAGMLAHHGAVTANATAIKPAAVAAAPMPGAAASGVKTSAPAKDIVLDAGTALPGAMPGRLVPTPGGGAAAAAPARAAPADRAYNAATHDAATSGALAELALNLMRQASSETGDAQRNAVVSPFSLVSALGMVHAGSAGATARELSTLLGSTSAGERIYTRRLPVLLDRLAPVAGNSGPFVMANRVWVDQAAAAALPPSYAALVADRFNADGMVLPFADAKASRAAINSWVAQRTANRIKELMPDGSITPNTRVVVTNAIHFKSPWAQPFDPAATIPKPFKVMAGAPKPVPTMVDERQVRTGVVDNVSVIELPFVGGDYVLLVGMPPEGHTLNAFETDLEGLDLASWSSQLKPMTCRLELPKFTIAPASKPLKHTLEALGVKTAFSPDADLSPMLGKAAKGVSLDNVYQSAAIIIDEQGGEAAAATGAAGSAKSFSMPVPACAVDRPFIFAVVHKPSGAPLFVGKVADPSVQ